MKYLLISKTIGVGEIVVKFVCYFKRKYQQSYCQLDFWQKNNAN